MQSGYYKLTQDVTNPKPDRRSKRRLDCASVWPAGTVVYIKNDAARVFQQAQEAAGERLPDDAMPEPLGSISFKDGTQVQFNLGLRDTRFPEETQGNGILAALTPATKTLGQVLKQADWTAEGLLALLIDTGKITLADVEAIKHHDLTPEEDGNECKVRDAALENFYRRHEI